MKNLIEFLDSIQDTYIFSIMHIKGLFVKCNGILWRIDFDKHGCIILTSAQDYYIRNIFERGLPCIHNVIYGSGDCYTVVGKYSLN